MGTWGHTGAPNSSCPQLDVEVDFCRLATAPEMAGFVGHPLVAVVEVSEFGVSDLTSGVDVSPLLQVEIGWGPVDMHPDDGGWNFAPGLAVGDWVGEPADRDGYNLGLVFDAVGTYAGGGAGPVAMVVRLGPCAIWAKALTMVSSWTKPQSRRSAPTPARAWCAKVDLNPRAAMMVLSPTTHWPPGRACQRPRRPQPVITGRW